MSLWTRDGNQAQVRTLVDAWNDSHDNQIEVTVIPAGEFVTKVGTAVAGGAAPDIIAIDLIYVPAFAAAGQMTDITDLAKELPYFDELSHSHVRLATYEDKIHALPFNAEGSVLFYNKDLFEQAGLDPESPPTTWAEIAEASEAISALGDDIYGYYFSGACAGCNAFTFLPLIWASGGDVLNEDGTAATMDDPMVAAALEFYKGLWDAGQVPAGAQVDSGSEFANTFPGGNIGMQGLGAFAINMLKTDFPEVNFGVAPLPGMDGGDSSFAGGDSIGIPAGSEYVDEAFEFLAWLTSEDVQLEHYAAGEQLAGARRFGRQRVLCRRSAPDDECQCHGHRTYALYHGLQPTLQRRQRTVAGDVPNRHLRRRCRRRDCDGPGEIHRHSRRS